MQTHSSASEARYGGGIPSPSSLELGAPALGIGTFRDLVEPLA